MRNDRDQDHEMSDLVSFKRLVGAFRQGILWIVLGLFLGLGTAFLYSKLQTPVYAATTQVMVARSNVQGPAADVTQQLSTQQVVQTYVDLLSQDWVQADISKRVGGQPVDKSQVRVSADANTQVILIRVEDADPQRAILIANILVKILNEQNESIQSTRYNEAEASLDLQISDLESKISDLQAKLEAANSNAFNQQVANAQSNINTTQQNIRMIEDQITWLNGLGDSYQAQAMLAAYQSEQEQDQAALDQQQSDYQTLQDRLVMDSQVQQDPAQVADIQSQITALESSMQNIRQELDELATEIAKLSPLVKPGEIENELETQQLNLDAQAKLLGSYQDLYTELLVSGKISGTTEEITSLEKNLDLYQQIYLNALDNRESVQLARMQNVTNIVQFNPPSATESPVRPRVLLNTILGGVAGLILAVSFILVKNYLDTTLKTREDVEQFLELPVLGYSLHMDTNNQDQPLPQVVRLPRSPAAEAFRSLRTNLNYIGVDKPIKSILVASPGKAEGKTTIAVNLAAIMAQGGKSVVLLDADLRRPRVHRELGLVNHTGLSNAFLENISVLDTIQICKGLDFSVVTSGRLPPNPAELLASEKMGHILEVLETSYDYVIVDSTPTIVTDSQLIAARVGGVLLTISPGSTQIEAARTAVAQYRQVGARLLGVVINMVKASQGYYGRYTPYSNASYYDYDAGRKEGSDSRPVAKATSS